MSGKIITCSVPPVPVLQHAPSACWTTAKALSLCSVDSVTGVLCFHKTCQLRCGLIVHIFCFLISPYLNVVFFFRRWFHSSCQGLHSEEDVEKAADSCFDCTMCRTFKTTKGDYFAFSISRRKVGSTFLAINAFFFFGQMSCCSYDQDQRYN